MPLLSFAADASNNIFDFIDHGTIAINAKSDTVYTNNDNIYIGGKLGTKSFIVVTPYPIVKYTHNKLVLLNTSQIYVNNSIVSKPVLQSILNKKLNKKMLKSIQ